MLIHATHAHTMPKRRDQDREREEAQTLRRNRFDPLLVLSMLRLFFMGLAFPQALSFFACPGITRRRNLYDNGRAVLESGARMASLQDLAWIEAGRVVAYLSS